MLIDDDNKSQTPTCGLFGCSLAPAGVEKLRKYLIITLQKRIEIVLHTGRRFNGIKYGFRVQFQTFLSRR